MTPELLFKLCNALALAGWVGLIVFPRWRYTNRLVHTGLISLFLAAVYLVVVAVRMPRAEGGFGSLADVARLFSDPYLLLAGWIHYLAFDLFIGAWEARDARRRGVPHLLVVPCLVMTFMLGPVGLLAYHGVRAARGVKTEYGE